MFTHRKVGYLRRHHRPLTFVQVSPVKIDVEESDLRSESERKSEKKKRGRQTQPGSTSRAADRVGVPKQTVADAPSHVRAANLRAHGRDADKSIDVSAT